MKKITKIEEENIILRYYEIFNATKIAKEFIRNKKTILSILRRNNIKLKSYSEIRGITREIEEKVCTLYFNNTSSTIISKSLGISQPTVLRILRSNNIEIKKSNNNIYKKFTLDEDFFENINTEEKAYFLGLMVADGNVTKEGRVKIMLQEEDKDILISFKKAINYGGEIIYTNRRNKKWKNCENLWFCSKQIVNDLAKYGVIPNKSYSTYFPNIPTSLYHHFIRGVFDGDGCISIQKNKYIFSICGNKELIESIQLILMEKCSLNKTVLETKKIGWLGLRSVKYSGNIQVLRIKEYLYKDATLFLKRKYNKFNNIKITWKQKYPEDFQ